jgi:hypothetical protein
MELAHGFQDHRRRRGVDYGIPKAMGAPGFLSSGFLPSFPLSIIKGRTAYPLLPFQNVIFILHIPHLLSIKFSRPKTQSLIFLARLST